jgi:hypothetical protein
MVLESGKRSPSRCLLTASPVSDGSGFWGPVLRFSGAVKRDPAVQVWLNGRPEHLRAMVRPWFERMRKCGDDVRELMHDGCPTVCVGDAGFGYVNSFRAHANVGFFRGSTLKDPVGLLEGTGKLGRHVKLTPSTPPDSAALGAVITEAYRNIKACLRAEEVISRTRRRAPQAKPPSI